MSVTDPIADLFTRIRNAAHARKTLVHLPFSKLKFAIAQVLKEAGYLVEVKAIGEGVKKEIMIELLENRPELHIKSVSRPGQRIYVKFNEIPRVLDGLGIAVVSTSKGVMRGDLARKQKLGGEFLCEVY